MHSTCLIYTGKAQTAAEQLAGFLRGQETDPHALSLLAVALICAGKKNEALPHIATLQDTGFNAGLQLTDFAKAIASTGQTGHAVAILEAVTEQNLADDGTRLLLSELRKSQGKDIQ
jgi:predicted Zn-dependent protease